MALNEQLDWTAVGAIVTDRNALPVPTTVADAFKLDTGPPSKDLLPAGTLLYKFNSGPTFRLDWATKTPIPDPPPADYMVSPWWSPTLPYKQDGGLSQRMNLARLNGVSMREWGRLTSVIKEDWGSLAYILQIELKAPVYAWFGRFKGMARIGTGTSMRDGGAEKSGGGKNLPGGGTQFYIPNMAFGGYVATFVYKNI